MNQEDHVHIDDWLDQVTTTSISLGEKMARAFLEYKRLPAWKQMLYDPMYNDLAIFCQYKLERYRCVGASRLGDIWLSKNYKDRYGYSLRVYVDEVSNWTFIRS